MHIPCLNRLRVHSHGFVSSHHCTGMAGRASPAEFLLVIKLLEALELCHKKGSNSVTFTASSGGFLTVGHLRASHEKQCMNILPSTVISKRLISPLSTGVESEAAKARQSTLKRITAEPMNVQTQPTHSGVHGLWVLAYLEVQQQWCFSKNPGRASLPHHPPPHWKHNSNIMIITPWCHLGSRYCFQRSRRAKKERVPCAFNSTGQPAGGE